MPDKKRLTLGDYWNGPLGSFVRGVYTAAVSAGIIYALDHLASLHWPDTEKWKLVAAITAVVRGFVDKPIRMWVAKWVAANQGGNNP
jgi:hypothetical protein